MNLFGVFRNARKFFGVFWRDCSQCRKGQTNRDAIVQTAHRLEKGLTIQNPRKLWGWDKTAKLAARLADELDKPAPDRFALETGGSVLKAYLDAKMRTGDMEERDKATALLENAPKIRSLLASISTRGGACNLRKEDVFFPDGAVWLEKLYSTRHSIRDFADTPVPREILLQAVQMALLAPSACNRQPSKIYVLEGKRREESGYENAYHADKYLVVTGEINAFGSTEYGDWIVSSSIFATYLVLALHALGIGSCMMKKDLHFGSKYNDFLRKACKIPCNEKIVLEIAVGYCKDSFAVACSNRKNARNVLVFP